MRVDNILFSAHLPVDKKALICQEKTAFPHKIPLLLPTSKKYPFFLLKEETEEVP